MGVLRQKTRRDEIWQEIIQSESDPDVKDTLELLRDLTHGGNFSVTALKTLQDLIFEVRRSK